MLNSIAKLRSSNTVRKNCMKWLWKNFDQEKYLWEAPLSKILN